MGLPDVSLPPALGCDIQFQCDSCAQVETQVEHRFEQSGSEWGRQLWRSGLVHKVCAAAHEANRASMLRLCRCCHCKGAKGLGRRKGSPVQGRTENPNYLGVILPILGNLPYQVGRLSFTLWPNKSKQSCLRTEPSRQAAHFFSLFSHVWGCKRSLHLGPGTLPQPNWSGC